MILQKNETRLILLCAVVVWCSSSFIELNAFTLWSLWHFLIKIDNTFRHLWRLILFLRINSIAFERTCHNITENDITGTYLVWIKLKKLQRIFGSHILEKLVEFGRGILLTVFD